MFRERERAHICRHDYTASCGHIQVFGGGGCWMVVNGVVSNCVNPWASKIVEKCTPLARQSGERGQRGRKAGSQTTNAITLWDYAKRQANAVYFLCVCACACLLNGRAMLCTMCRYYNTVHIQTQYIAHKRVWSLRLTTILMMRGIVYSIYVRGEISVSITADLLRCRHRWACVWCT